MDYLHLVDISQNQTATKLRTLGQYMIGHQKMFGSLLKNLI